MLIYYSTCTPTLLVYRSRRKGFLLPFFCSIEQKKKKNRWYSPTHLCYTLPAAPARVSRVYLLPGIFYFYNKIFKKIWYR